ncbi:bll3463 [Bradyrhizobium diazoefficiens USDA 110]|uniref:Bll3463 protein n=1 Tax=Bradyrhizobium diazoefficiens (strain JCM 10833 / BCRC 13528 / IAM 13628 / NBRC 14792 / USDA 110) TaxID=224911 RepID=Q89PL7_BRADU|nr:hypothetical protein CO678_00515 [Bradyrhizobium diazoefficiens]QBP22252.1 hypothetical protein Bdiaspc4_17890 [Bradyrhizobium diazoefficiens]QHP71495.1 hypothetical protein EI171_32035 [Bradyrhizobium sp. LCT2]BAC48728.1 bll3463 [Bradyrhizobium diazoefficiens USDA 110]
MARELDRGRLDLTQWNSLAELQNTFAVSGDNQSTFGPADRSCDAGPRRSRRNPPGLPAAARRQCERCLRVGIAPHRIRERPAAAGANFLFLKGESLVPFRDAVNAALERRHAEVRRLWAEALESIGITTRRGNDEKP